MTAGEAARHSPLSEPFRASRAAAICSEIMTKSVPSTPRPHSGSCPHSAQPRRRGWRPPGTRSRLAIGSAVVVVVGTLGAQPVLAQSGPTPDTAPPTVIIDGDVGPDPCDFANLAMAHSLHASGDIEVLGYMSTMPEPSNIAVLDIMKRWYDHDFPLAMFPAHTDDGYQRFVVPSSEFVHHPPAKDATAVAVLMKSRMSGESTSLRQETAKAVPGMSTTGINASPGRP